MKTLFRNHWQRFIRINFGFRVAADILLILLVQFIQSCSRDEQIVARIGSSVISLDEYRQAYLQVLKQPDKFDSRQLRESFLNELINRHLLADWARKEGIDSDERLELQVEAYRNKQLREAHFKTVITPQVEADSVVLRQVFAYKDQRRRIRHLFSRTRAGAQILYQRLLQGGDWDSLAAEIYRDSTLAFNGGDLGWLYWDQLEFDLAMTAFSLPAHTFSKPVQSSFGWHIIRVDDFEINPLLSEQDFRFRESDVRQLVENRIGDKLASRYINKRMAEVDIKVHPQILKIVGQHLKALFTRQPQQSDRFREMQLTDAERGAAVTALRDYRHEKLAEIDGKPMTVADFIGALDYIPYAAVHAGFKRALDFALRDFVLTEDARRAGLEADSNVQLRTGIFRDYLVQLKVKRRLIHNTVVNRDELQRYYTENRQRLFKTTALPEAEPIIRAQLLPRKQQAVVEKFIEQLRTQNRVETFPEAIHRFYDGLNKERDKNDR